MASRFLDSVHKLFLSQISIVRFKKGKMVFLKMRFSCTKKNIIGCKFEWFAHYCVNFGKVKGTYEKPWIIVLWDYFVNYGILCCCLHLMHFLWTPFFALKIDVLKFTGSLKAEWRRRYPSKGSWVCHHLFLKYGRELNIIWNMYFDIKKISFERLEKLSWVFKYGHKQIFTLSS